jgi:microcystin-dependent protein
MNKFIEDFKTIILVILVILVINLYLSKDKNEYMTTDAVNYLPSGTIVAYNSTIAPSGWALCDGNNGTPNLNNRFILGSGNKSINTTGGSETVTLNISQLPSHSHNVAGSTHIGGNHGHSFMVGGGDGGGGRGGGNGTTAGYTNYGNSGFITNTYNSGNHSHNFNVNSGSTGENQSHENMPPFYVLTYIIKL